MEVVNRSGEYYEAYEDLPYKLLRIDELYKEEITGKSGTLKFDSGRSYFLSFELPYAPSYTLTIASLMVGENIHQAAVFYPTLIFLNTNHKILYTIDSLPLKRAGINETWGLSYKYEAVLDMVAGENNPRYLVICTTPLQRSLHTSVNTMQVVPIIMPGFVGAVPVGKDEILVPHAATGRFRIQLTANRK
jgi:hypothetical protein